MILALVLACASAPDAPTPAPQTAPESVPEAAPPAPDPGAPCVPGQTPTAIGRTLEVQLFVDRSVPADRVKPLVDGAVAWWADWGVELVVNGPVEVDLPAALGGSRAELDAAFAARGIEPGKPPAPEQHSDMIEAVSEVVLGPTRTWLMHRAVPHRIDGIDVVIVPRVAAPDSPVDQAFLRMDGLTLRPEQAQRKDALGTLVAQLKIEAFTPTVFLGLSGIDARSPGGWEGTLTHEIGHGLGLEHVTDPNNLMVEQAPRCVPALDPVQVEQLRR